MQCRNSEHKVEEWTFCAMESRPNFLVRRCANPLPGRKAMPYGIRQSVSCP